MTTPNAAAKPSSLLDTRVIYCGDNLDQLRKLPDACVDLIYIDPPFNSNRNYEVFWGETREKRAFDDRHASTQAYIEFMRPRCLELARVLKKTGSFYYHCDWHASHYVKVMLDQILGENSFQNEIVWRRTKAHNDPNRYGANHDAILFYTRSDQWTWHSQYTTYSQEYLERNYRYRDPDGRRFRVSDMTANKPGGDTSYEWTTPDGRKVLPYKGRYWAYSKDKMKELHEAGRIFYRKTGMPMLKHYIEDMPGVPLQTFWDDIQGVISGSRERLGYPTQKPLALLERIIQASSNPNDIVLDAFCGCGTALVAAQNLGRQWIGIDISPTACRVMAKRMRDVCGLREDEKLWRIGRGFVVRDLPWTEAQLRKLPHFEFENWAVIALGGIPNKAQVGDMGIDGRIYPVSAVPSVRSAAFRPSPPVGSAAFRPSPPPPVHGGTEGGREPAAPTPPLPAGGEGEADGLKPALQTQADLGFMDIWYPIQVKQKDKAGRPDIDSFEAVMTREDRTKGFFVAFDYSQDALTEIDAFFRHTGKVVIPLTVKEILEEQIARKLV